VAGGVGLVELDWLGLEPGITLAGWIASGQHPATVAVLAGSRFVG
jgi:hypothetical protein